LEKDGRSENEKFVFNMFIQRYYRSFLKVCMFFGLPYSTTMANNNYQVFEKILGYENRKNDVIFFPNTTKSIANGIVYYFGGDIQVE